MNTDEIFVSRFRELYSNSSLTQKDLAYKLNMTQSALSKQLNGKNKVSADVLVQISEYFGTSTDYLLGKTNQRYRITMEESDDFHLPPEVAKSYASLGNDGKEYINTMIVCLASRCSSLR